jgi:hypothetical protein
MVTLSIVRPWHSELASQPRDNVIREHWGQNGLPTPILTSNSNNAASKDKPGRNDGEHLRRGNGPLRRRTRLSRMPVRDATVAFSAEAMRAAHEINGPAFAHAILTTDAVIAVLVKT